MIIKEERIGGQRLILGDCLEVMKVLGRFDAVVTDPPYGINWKPRVNHQDQRWVDRVDFDPMVIISKADESTVWGAEYLSPLLPPSKSWLTWVKRPVSGFDFSEDSRTYATTELAWSNIGKSCFFALTWDGGMRAGDKSNRTFCHPSQKPIELMQWCIRRHKSATTILDPFMGSGTTLVACQRMGRQGTGIELDPEYFEIACKRVDEATRQPDMFVQTVEDKPTQESFL